MNDIDVGGDAGLVVDRVDALTAVVDDDADTVDGGDTVVDTGTEAEADVELEVTTLLEPHPTTNIAPEIAKRNARPRFVLS